MPPQLSQGSNPQPQSAQQPQLQGQLMSAPQPDMTQKTNQAKASMGFATNLMTQMLQHQAPQAPQESKPVPEEEKSPEPSKEEPKDITKELTDFKTEIEGLLDSKLGDLKREIEMALKDEPDEKEEQTPTSA